MRPHNWFEKFVAACVVSIAAIAVIELGNPIDVDAIGMSGGGGGAAAAKTCRQYDAVQLASGEGGGANQTYVFALPYFAKEAKQTNTCQVWGSTAMIQAGTFRKIQMFTACTIQGGTATVGLAKTSGCGVEASLGLTAGTWTTSGSNVSNDVDTWHVDAGWGVAWVVKTASGWAMGTGGCETMKFRVEFCPD